MISLACLIWIGLQLNAPTWYFMILGIGLLIKILDLGIKLGELSKN